MAGLPPGQEAGPTAELPPWLSYTSSPTATREVVYTYATLLQDGVPTLATSAAIVTQYGTDLLQLPITVDASAVAGQDLGTLYTIAGGTATQTVVGSVGGTRRVTLDAAPSTVAADSASGESASTAASDGAAASGTRATTSTRTHIERVLSRADRLCDQVWRLSRRRMTILARVLLPGQAHRTCPRTRQLRRRRPLAQRHLPGS